MALSVGNNNDNQQSQYFLLRLDEEAVSKGTASFVLEKTRAFLFLSNGLITV
jgi:hypothetical protein